MEEKIMAKIAVVCAAGKEGRLLVEEAIARGHEVTGFVRSADQAVNTAAKRWLKTFDITASDLEGFDVVIDAFGAWTPKPCPCTGRRLCTCATS